VTVTVDGLLDPGAFHPDAVTAALDQRPGHVDADLLVLRVIALRAHGDVAGARRAVDEALDGKPVGHSAYRAAVAALVLADDADRVEAAAVAWTAGRTAWPATFDLGVLSDPALAHLAPAIRARLTAPLDVAERSAKVRGLGLMRSASPRQWQTVRHVAAGAVDVHLTIPTALPDDPSHRECAVLVSNAAQFVTAVLRRNKALIRRAVADTAKGLADLAPDLGSMTAARYRVTSIDASLRECTASADAGLDITIAVNDDGSYAAAFLAH
jgi:hypothetical protein